MEGVEEGDGRKGHRKNEHGGNGKDITNVLV